MTRPSLPSPRSARRLLFGAGPKPGNPFSFVPEKPIPKPLFLSMRTGGDCSKDRQALDDCQALVRRFRESRRSVEVARRLMALREDRQVSFDQVDAPSLRVSPTSSILKRPNSSVKPHGRHVSFGDVTVHEIENCLTLRPPPPVSSPVAPVRPSPAAILKRPGSAKPHNRHVSFGDVTVREIENCLAPTPRPFPPPAHSLFPPSTAAQFRPPVESHPVEPHPLRQANPPACEPRRQRHLEVTTVYKPIEWKKIPWGKVLGTAAAVVGFSWLLSFC